MTDLEGVRTEEKVERRRHTKLVGSWGMLPHKMFELRASEMPFPAFSAGHFNTTENAVVRCLFYPSLVLSVKYSVYGKRSKK